ncbi:MAG TPA: amidohydrolase family protein [Syntrophorhabdaceae bacterium]|jgi:hypothetical protein
MDIIDGHTHIFPPEIVERRKTIALTDEGFSRIYGDLRATMVDHEGLLKYMERERVLQAVACGFPFEDKGLIELANNYILECARADPRIIPMASINIRNRETGIREAERCLGLGAKGIGEVALYEVGLGRDELKLLDEVARLAAVAKVPLLLHLNEQVGHQYSGKVAVDFGEVTKFVEAHQDVTFVLAHLGGGLCFYEFMPEIRNAFTRVFYDTAALPYIYSIDTYRFIDAFLAKKTLFGSDYPLLSFKRYDGGIQHLREEGMAAVLSGNARRVYLHG